MLDPVQFGQAMARIVNEAVGPLQKRIDAQAERIRELEAAERDISGEVRPILAGLVAEYMQEHPVRDGADGADGKDGEPGRDADPVDVAEVVRELVACADIRPILSMLVAEYMQEHPVRDGKDGEPGRDGADGAPGRDGEDGRPGEMGQKGEKGEPGKDGEDGIGLAGAMIDRDGTLIITTSKGEAHRLGCVVGKDGAPGRDGIDAIDFDVERTGEREFSIRFVRDGAVVKERKITMPMMIYRGQWVRERRYEEGDTVSRDGNLWVAKQATDAMPSFENREHWEVAARKGRDGAVRVAKESPGPDPKILRKPEGEE